MPTPLPPNMRLELLPPPEAVEAFKRRGLLTPSFSWQDIYGAEHGYQFTVAKMMRLDLLQLVYDQLQSVVDAGESLAQFERALTPKLQDAGWWGEQEVIDPTTGEPRVAQLGSPERLRLIYEVNLRQSYAAGRWERIERTKRVNPLIIYRTMRDERVRASHRAWDGLVLPVDHPFWRTHYPQNGWRCRCIAYGVNERGVERLERAGMRIQREAPPIEYVEFTNRRTGEVVSVPRGIDPGFEHNPGIRSARAKALQMSYASKLAGAAPPIAQAARDADGR